MKFNIFIIILIGVSSTFNSCRALKNKKNKTSHLIEHQMELNGYERNYFVYEPKKLDHSKPLALLFNIHGGGGTAEGTAAKGNAGFQKWADKDNFIIVYPNAVEKNWNDGRRSDKVLAWKENIDDVGFIVSIIDELSGIYSIDKNRIFTAGISNGGFMSSRLVCDRADLFRGAAIVTATISEDYLPHCDPSNPVAVIVFNGTDDPLVPYNGGHVKVLGQKRGKIISTDDYIQFWQGVNGCRTQKKTINLPDLKDDGTTVSIEEYSNCNERGELILYKINGGGHTWPGGKQYLGERLVGKVSREIDAFDVIWEFFKSQ